MNLQRTLSSIYHVDVTPDARLSSHACRKCVDTAVSLHSKLQSLQSMAKESYHKKLSQADSSMGPSVSIGPQKRSKDTSSGPGISPATLKSQPPRKRSLGMGKKLFPSGKRKINHHTRLIFFTQI